MDNERNADLADTGLGTEQIQEIFLTRQPDLKSPYGLYGYPAMWNILIRDGLTMAARPSPSPERGDFGIAHVPGICIGWHRDGRWVESEQERVMSIPYFIENFYSPALANGATLIEQI